MSTNPDQLPEDQEKQERRPTLFIVLALLLLLIIICGVAYVVMNNTQTNTAAGNQTEEPTEEQTEAIEETEEASATFTETATSTATFTATATATETSTPTPTATATFRVVVTTVVPSQCADHGGQSFAGDICVCPGIIDKVVICADGTKFDNPTTQACTPKEACQPGGGGVTNPAPTCGCQGTTWVCTDGTAIDCDPRCVVSACKP